MGRVIATLVFVSNQLNKGNIKDLELVCSIMFSDFTGSALQPVS